MFNEEQENNNPYGSPSWQAEGDEYYELNREEAKK